MGTLLLAHKPLTNPNEAINYNSAFSGWFRNNRKKRQFDVRSLICKTFQKDMLVKIYSIYSKKHIHTLSKYKHVYKYINKIKFKRKKIQRGWERENNFKLEKQQIKKNA